MAKQVTANLKLRIPAGKASAGPPVGSTLGQYGLNMMDFINPFNDQTKDIMGSDVIVHLRIYDDRTFDYDVIGEPVDDMIRKALADELLFGKLVTGGKVTVDMDENEKIKLEFSENDLLPPPLPSETVEVE